MTTATARRRNMRAENCKACGTFCQAGEGYLYRDTNGLSARRTHNRTGRFGWFVKCEKCHAGNETKLTVKMAKYAAAHASDPVIRPWSTSQTKRWVVRHIERLGDAAIVIESDTFSQIVSYRDRINGRFSADCGYTLEQHGIASKPLSANAADELSDRIQTLSAAIQKEEEAACEAGVAKLLAAGAVITNDLYSHIKGFTFNGGNYHVWGHIGGTNKVSGVTAYEGGRWIKTTVEELIGETDARS